MAISQRDYYERSEQPPRSTLTSCNAGPTCCQPSSVPTSRWNGDERGSRVDPPRSRNVSFAKDALARDAERSYYASRYGESASALHPKDSYIGDRPSGRANSNYPIQQEYNQPQSRASQIPNDYGVPVNTVPEAFTNGRPSSGFRDSSAHQDRDHITNRSFAHASRLNNYAVQQEFQASQAPDDYGVPVTAPYRQADDRSFARANNYSVQQESKASTASHIPNDYGVPVTAPYNLTNDRRFSRARKIFANEDPQRTHTSRNVDMPAGAFQNQAGEARGNFQSADQSQFRSNYRSDPFTGQQGPAQSEVDYWRQKSIESDAIIQSLQKQNARLRDDRDELEADVNRSMEERISWEIAYKQLYAAKMGKEAEVRALRKLSEDAAMADIDDEEDSLNFRRIQGRYRPVFYGKYY